MGVLDTVPAELDAAGPITIVEGGAVVVTGCGVVVEVPWPPTRTGWGVVVVVVVTELDEVIVVLDETVGKRST